MTNKILAILQFEKCDYIKCKDGGYFIHEKHCISKQRIRDAINQLQWDNNKCGDYVLGFRHAKVAILNELELGVDDNDK